MSQSHIMHVLGPGGAKLPQSFGELIHDFPIHAFHRSLRLWTVDHRSTSLDAHNLCNGIYQLVAEFGTIVAR